MSSRIWVQCSQGPILNALRRTLVAHDQTAITYDARNRVGKNAIAVIALRDGPFEGAIAVHGAHAEMAAWMEFLPQSYRHAWGYVIVRDRPAAHNTHAGIVAWLTELEPIVTDACVRFSRLPADAGDSPAPEEAFDHGRYQEGFSRA